MKPVNKSVASALESFDRILQVCDQADIQLRLNACGFVKLVGSSVYGSTNLSFQAWTWLRDKLRTYHREADLADRDIVAKYCQDFQSPQAVRELQRSALESFGLSAAMAVVDAYRASMLPVGESFIGLKHRPSGYSAIVRWYETIMREMSSQVTAIDALKVA